jgi:Sec7-like guanine-nucleotide exchange factor
LKNVIKNFNEAEKPIKVVKKLIAERYFHNDPKHISQWLHMHLKKLNFVNLGQLIGDCDPLSIQICDEFIHILNLKDVQVDEALRILFAHFTPGG